MGKRWRYKKRTKGKRLQSEEDIVKEKIEEGKDIEIKGVLFVPHTRESELAKRIRKKLGDLENVSCLRIKVVERAGEKITDILHKSNPWEETSCRREDCLFCYGNNEKMIGKCKQRSVVYETICMLCERKKKKKMKENSSEISETDREEKTGVKRNREFLLDNRERRMSTENTETQTKYIGETSRSGYERIREHMSDLINLRKKSHILKHYLECHKEEIKMEEMEMSVRIVRRYRTSFERQIGESVEINHNLGLGATLLNSKNEYNRCTIPRLKVMDRDEVIEEIEEQQRERKLKKEIEKLKERLGRTGKEPRSKKPKLLEIGI